MTLDYGGHHFSFNDKNGVIPGIIKVIFSDQTRTEVESVLWRDEGATEFVDPVVDTAISSDSELSNLNLLLGREGALRLISHFRRERVPVLREKKLNSIRQEGLKLICEACSFDFSARYVSLGDSACEVHHIVPLYTSGERDTALRDLAILCANCHRAIHRTNPMLCVSEFARDHVRRN